MKSLRPQTADAGLFVVLIASNAELEILIEAMDDSITPDNSSRVMRDDAPLQNLRVDLMQARFGRKNATR